MSSLRSRLTLQVVTLLGLIGLAMLAIAGVALGQTSSGLGGARADDLADILASSLRASVDFEDTAGMGQALARVGAAEGAAYAAVSDDGKIVVETGFIEGFDMPGDPAALDSSKWIVRKRQIGTGEHQVLLVLSRARQRGVVNNALTVLVGVTLLLILGGAGAAWVLAGRLVAPVVELTQVTSRIIETGDLRENPAVYGNDEVGRLATSFGALLGSQRLALASLRQAAIDLGDVGGRVDNVGGAFRVVALDVDRRVRASVEAAQSVRVDVGTATRRVQGLIVRGESGAAALGESATASELAADALLDLSSQSAAAAAQVTDVVSAVSATADRVAAGEAALRDVATSMGRVSGAAQEVEGASGELRALSSRVRDGAAAGRQLVTSFAAGITAMRDSADVIAERVGSLAVRMQEIQSVVGVINEVAEQTNLLALNASILAAQAAHHGDGFAVVATSIKELSLRTRVSTGQIAALIAEVIAEASAAASAANDGGAAVDVGSARALDATRAIETVLADTAAALTRVDAVASLATTQVADLRAADVGLGAALSSLAEMARAASRQRATAGELEETMHRLRMIAQSVDRALAAQREKAGGAGAAILEMRNLIADVASSQLDQEDALGRLIEQVDAIAAANARQRAPLQSLDDALPALKSGAERLSSETQRFLL